MPINRRRFFALSAGASLAPSAVVVANTRREYMVQSNGCAVNAETRSYWLPPPPDQPTWTLSVIGDVATAMQLTLTGLRSMPVTEVTCAGVKATAKHRHTSGSDDPPKSVPPLVTRISDQAPRLRTRPVGY
jgi:hypothetical protein